MERYTINTNYIPYGVPVDRYGPGPVIYPSGRSVGRDFFLNPQANYLERAYLQDDFIPNNGQFNYGRFNYRGVYVNPLVNGENIAASQGYRFTTMANTFDLQQSIPRNYYPQRFFGGGGGCGCY